MVFGCICFLYIGGRYRNIERNRGESEELLVRNPTAFQTTCATGFTQPQTGRNENIYPRLDLLFQFQKQAGRQAHIQSY